MTHASSFLVGLVLITTLATADTPSAGIVPVMQDGDELRHNEKARAAQRHSYDLLLIGDSIVENLETQPFRVVWDRYFTPHNTLNLGYSGARTENILWNLAHGELDGQSPKAVVLLIGTNNSDDANYPIAHSAEQIAAGTAAILDLLRSRCPKAKILLLRIFPRARIYLKADGSERGDHNVRATVNTRASELCAQMADGEHIFFLDVNHVFHRSDGTIDPQLMPDLLHPSPEGAEAWARTMEPTLLKLLGSKPERQD